MKQVPSLTGIVVLLLALGSVASAADQWVLVPSDTTPFTMEQTDLVRLTGNTISGGTVTATVTGPAKIIREDIVTPIHGEAIPIGGLTKEFLVEPTGRGQVSVTITMTHPQPNLKPKTTTYRFTVK